MAEFQCALLMWKKKEDASDQIQLEQVLKKKKENIVVCSRIPEHSGSSSFTINQSKLKS